MIDTIVFIAQLLFVAIGFKLSGIGYTTIFLPRHNRPKTNHSHHSDNKFEDVIEEGHPTEVCGKHVSETVHYFVYLAVIWFGVIGASQFISYGASEDQHGLLISNTKELNSSYSIGGFAYIITQGLLGLFFYIFYHPTIIGHHYSNFAISSIFAMLSMISALVTFICFALILTWHGWSNHYFNYYYLSFLPAILFLPQIVYIGFLIFTTLNMCYKGYNYGKST